VRLAEWAVCVVLLELRGQPVAAWAVPAREIALAGHADAAASLEGALGCIDHRIDRTARLGPIGSSSAAPARRALADAARGGDR
jgi:hypothetical protein